MHFSHFPRTCTEQALMERDYTTRGMDLAGPPTRFEVRGLSGPAQCEACHGRYEMPRPSIPVGGTALAVAQRGAVKAVRIHCSGCGHRDDRNAMPLERAVLEGSGVSLHSPVIAIELRLPGASRGGPVGASGSAREPERTQPTARRRSYRYLQHREGDRPPPRCSRTLGWRSPRA